MKQKTVFFVYNNVLTYFKDVFDGTSPEGDVLVFFNQQNHHISNPLTLQNH